MSEQREDDGLLFVYGEPGPVLEDEFNDWYDKEHIPARLALSNFSTAARYKATDGIVPSWIAVFDTTTPEVMQSSAYKALGANAPEKEKGIIKRLSVLNRRVYRRLATVSAEPTEAQVKPKVLLVVGILPGDEERKEEVNKWYEQEHLGMLATVPGFVKARRYAIVGSPVELAGSAVDGSGGVAFPLITLYEWDNERFMEEPKFKEAVETEWSRKVMGGVESVEMRVFELYKEFKK